MFVLGSHPEVNNSVYYVTKLFLGRRNIQLIGNLQQSKVWISLSPDRLNMSFSGIITGMSERLLTGMGMTQPYQSLPQHR